MKINEWVNSKPNFFGYKLLSTTFGFLSSAVFKIPTFIVNFLCLKLSQSFKIWRLALNLFIYFHCVKSLSWSATTSDTLTWKSETRTKIFTCRVVLGVQKCCLGWQCYSFHFGWFFSFLDNKLEPYDWGGILKFFHKTELVWYFDNLQFFWPKGFSSFAFGWKIH